MTQEITQAQPIWIKDPLAILADGAERGIVVREGRIVLAKAYGKANEGLPARTDLPYQIASNSKQFTAMALLLLEDEGKLDLDDHVAKYLPGISGGDRITICADPQGCVFAVHSKVSA